MASTNISIKQEAYDYLQSIKKEDESFSDAILKLKNQRKSLNTILDIMDQYEKPSKEHIKQREQAIKKQREDIEKRIR